MKRSHDDRHDSPPIEYLIPRHGTVHRIRIHDRNELRVFRTELELLRRIANAVRFQAPTRPIEHLKTLTAEAYLELDEILHDALHPLIETTIARVDREFADLRKDIAMPVVDEEAKKIAAEATEAGMNVADAPAEGDSCDIVGAMSVSEAFDVAEAGLAASAAGDSSAPAEVATPPVAESPEPETPIEDAARPGEPEESDTAAIEPTAVEEDVAHESSEPIEAPEAGGCDDASVQASSTTQDTATDAESEPPEPEAPVEGAAVPSEPEETSSAALEPTAVEENVAEESSEPVETPEPYGSDDPSAHAPPAPSDAATGVERVESAVAVIEQGIRKLAAMLKSEIQEHWTQAHKTLDEVNSSRAKIDEECKATREMLEDISRLRVEARIARDETDLARRDAKQLREAARVAKERAETSAAVAELAADQAKREAKSDQQAGLRDGDG